MKPGAVPAIRFEREALPSGGRRSIPGGAHGRAARDPRISASRRPTVPVHRQPGESRWVNRWRLSLASARSIQASAILWKPDVLAEDLPVGPQSVSRLETRPKAPGKPEGSSFPGDATMRTAERWHHFKRRIGPCGLPTCSAGRRFRTAPSLQTAPLGEWRADEDVARDVTLSPDRVCPNLYLGPPAVVTRVSHRLATSRE